MSAKVKANYKPIDYKLSGFYLIPFLSMVTKKDVKLGKNIARLRKGAGLTQEMLAEKTGLSLTFIGYLEIGQKRPALKTLNKIASVLKVKVKDLIPY